MDLEPDILNLPDNLFRFPQLFRGNGVEIVGIRIAFVIGTGYLKGVLAAEGDLIFSITPQGKADHHVRETITGNFDQTVGGTEGGETFVKGFNPVHAESGLTADKDGKVHPAIHLFFHKGMPFGHILFFSGTFMLTG